MLLHLLVDWKTKNKAQIDMEPRIAPENLSGIINQLMRQNQLSVDYVRRRLRGRRDPVHVHGKGRFECCCRNNNPGWTSTYSWISVDLSDQVISKRWRMKCKHCQINVLEPTFSLEEVDRMVTEAIRLFKGERRPYYGPRIGPRRERPAPHISELCEKCRWGRELCWRAPSYRPPPPPSNSPSENGTTSASELGDTDSE